MEGESQLLTHKHLVTFEETEVVQGMCQCLLALMEQLGDLHPPRASGGGQVGNCFGHLK